MAGYAGIVRKLVRRYRKIVHILWLVLIQQDLHIERNLTIKYDDPQVLAFEFPFQMYAEWHLVRSSGIWQGMVQLYYLH